MIKLNKMLGILLVVMITTTGLMARQQSLEMVKTSNLGLHEFRIHTNLLCYFFPIINLGIEYINDDIGVEFYGWHVDKNSFVSGISVKKIGVMLKKHMLIFENINIFYGAGVSYMESLDDSVDATEVSYSGAGIDGRVGIVFNASKNIYQAITWGIGYQPSVTAMNIASAFSSSYGIKVGYRFNLG